MKFELRKINNYEDYFIREDGKIISYKRNSNDPIIRKTRINIRGYEYVNLWNNGKCKSFVIHRLVAKAFISNPENKPEVNHIDGNKLNNHYSNLEWVTRSENEIHARKQLHKIGGRKAISVKAIKNNETIIFNSLHECSTSLKVDFSNLSKIIKTKTKNKLKGYSFEQIPHIRS